MSSCTERNPIRQRTETDQTADGIQSDGGRKPIGRRTQTVGGAAVSAAPTKPTEQSIPAISARLCRLPEQGLHQQSQQNYHFTNRSLIHAQRGIMRHATTSNR